MAETDFRNKIAIVGVGYTPQGKIPGRTAVGFHCEAIRNAIRDAGIEKEDIDALLLYRHFDAIGGDAETTAFTVSEQLGIDPSVVSQEKYCTRSWLYHSVGMLASGLCKYVVISYGDNARSGRRSFVKELSGNKATDELAAYGDLSTMAKYAMLSRRAMEKYGTGPDVWKEIAIAQRAWAELNPRAAMKNKPLDDQGYYDSSYIVEPLRLLDATPNSDGGRAIVLTTAERAKEMGQKAVLIRGFGSANKTASPFRLDVYDENSAAAVASRKAYAMAGVTSKDIDACELYDCFTYTVEATLRDYGFFKPGESKEFLTRKRLGPGGEFPVNTSGGMLSEGYFMGLTPVSEAVMQLRGECGERQLGVYPNTKKPELIMCSDNGAVFQSNLALILERGES
ncbi:MAG: thiolase family protein [Eubacteriales bacterium]|nr:thiolase family protein [Eubacteriales bacterium]